MYNIIEKVIAQIEKITNITKQNLKLAFSPELLKLVKHF